MKETKLKYKHKYKKKYNHNKSKLKNQKGGFFKKIASGVGKLGRGIGSAIGQGTYGVAKGTYKQTLGRAIHGSRKRIARGLGIRKIGNISRGTSLRDLSYATKKGNKDAFNELKRRATLKKYFFNKGKIRKAESLFEGSLRKHKTQALKNINPNLKGKK